MERLDQIKDTVMEISRYVKDGIDKDELKNRYSTFVEQYPSLFKMVIENGSYMEILTRMIDAAKRVEKGEYTVEEMDKMVGEELAKEYIYPNIDMSKES